MKKIFVLAAVLAVVAMVGATDASAVCGNNLTFGQSLPNCGGAYCYVVTPDGGMPQSGSFWAVGTGNPAVAAGNDNGSWALGTTAASWCRPSGPGCYMSGGWAADPGVDGCIDGNNAPGKTVEVMGVLFGTTIGETSYAAVAASSRNNAGLEFEFAQTAANITLQPIPAPNVTSTTRSAPNVSITVASPAIAFFTDGVAAASDVARYRVYKRIVPRGAPAPTGRDRAQWTAAGAITAAGTSFSFTETTGCATNSDIYLATAVATDSGFETGSVSANSRPVQCGPTIAEPGSDKGFKVIERKGGSTRTPSSN